MTLMFSGRAAWAPPYGSLELELQDEAKADNGKLHEATIYWVVRQLADRGHLVDKEQEELDELEQELEQEEKVSDAEERNHTKGWDEGRTDLLEFLNRVATDETTPSEAERARDVSRYVRYNYRTEVLGEDYVEVDDEVFPWDDDELDESAPPAEDVEPGE